MSRLYNCYVYTDDDVNEDVAETIESCCGECTLTAGISEEDYASTVSQKIWKEAEGYVPLTVNMTYLEDLPYESYSFGMTDYNNYSGGKEE
jgi:hypothetical protein